MTDDPDQWDPYDSAEHDLQIDGLLRLAGRLATRARTRLRTLDLGCGNGRTMIPLCQAGYECVGMDRDPNASSALARACQEFGLAEDVAVPAVHVHDFLTHPWPITETSFHLITCLGRTLMQVHRVEDAVALFRCIAQALAPAPEPAAFVIDDIPGELWPLVTDGSWGTGIAEDGSSQMIWDERDHVFTIRYGSAIRPEVEWLDEQDVERYRLWTLGDLALLADSCGLTAPQVDEESGLIWCVRSA